jgi:DNA-binding XRE family transcriptional regulator
MLNKATKKCFILITIFFTYSLSPVFGISRILGASGQYKDVLVYQLLQFFGFTVCIDEFTFCKVSNSRNGGEILQQSLARKIPCNHDVYTLSGSQPRCSFDDKFVLMNLNLDLGESIKRWRMFRGFKQEHLASKLGISRITLSKYENGRTKVPANTLCQIAKTLNRTVDEIVNL